MTIAKWILYFHIISFYISFWIVWEEHKSIEWILLQKAVLESKPLITLSQKNVAEDDTVTNLLRREYFVMLWEGHIKHLPHKNKGPLDINHMISLISIIPHSARLCWTSIHSVRMKKRYQVSYVGSKCERMSMSIQIRVPMSKVWDPILK